MTESAKPQEPFIDEKPDRPEPRVVENRVFFVPTKSRGIGLLLAFFFGPLGLFYSSLVLGLVLTFAALVFAFLTGGLSSPLFWLVSVILSPFLVNRYNRRKEAEMKTELCREK